MNDDGKKMPDTSYAMDDDEEKTPTCFAWWKRLKRLFKRRKRAKKPKCIADDKEAVSHDQDNEVKEKDREKNRALEEDQGEGAMDEGEEETAVGEKHGEGNVEEVIHIEKGIDEVVKGEMEEETVEEVIHSEEVVKEDIEEETVEEVIHSEEAVKGEIEEETVEEVIHSEEVVKEEMEEETVEEVIHSEKEDEEEGSVAAEAQAEGLALGSLCVSGKAPAADEEGWTVVRRRKRRPKGKEALPGLAQAKASSGEAPRPPAKSKPRKARKERQQAVSSVRASWQEEVTEVVVPVEPNMRRHIVGPSGATLRELLREFDGVSVAVPPQRDTVTRTVTLRGPPLQVNGAAKRVQSLLQDAQVVEAQVEVVPEQRRHVVGPGGATVRRLRRQFPGVAVIVPAADNRAARFVRLKGPRRQVTGAQAFIQACLEAAHAAHTTPGHVRPTANHLPANHQARTHAHGPSCHTAHHPSRR